MTEVEPKPCNKKHMLQWIEALESGEYEQTDSQLIRIKCAKEGEYKALYCCLGVCCVTAGLTPTPNPMLEGGWGFLGRDDVLPTYVSDWLGISEEDPKLFVPHLEGEYDGCVLQEVAAATHLNDEIGFTFKQIAEALRRTYGLPASD